MMLQYIHLRSHFSKTFCQTAWPFKVKVELAWEVGRRGGGGGGGGGGGAKV